jgi:NAD(P)-dependent dehydrogenase (short-subunit alcohol dehydrogenase family)
MTATQQHDLHGQKALVTGATSGIGRAIALQLARDGADVIVHGRDVTRGNEVVATITAAGGQAQFVVADLSNPADLARLSKEVGDLDILVNNAGMGWFGATAELSVDTFDTLFASNVRSAYFLVAAFVPAMVRRGTGSIINIGSMAGEVGLVGGAAYGATKAALALFARSWAAEFGPSGVRVNTVAAGPVYTSAQSYEATSAIGDTTLLKRAAQAEEIAEVVSFLASPRASYITGATIAADGGRTAV